MREVRVHRVAIRGAGRLGAGRDDGYCVYPYTVADDVAGRSAEPQEARIRLSLGEVVVDEVQDVPVVGRELVAHNGLSFALRVFALVVQWEVRVFMWAGSCWIPDVVGDANGLGVALSWCSEFPVCREFLDPRDLGPRIFARPLEPWVDPGMVSVRAMHRRL